MPWKLSSKTFLNNENKREFSLFLFISRHLHVPCTLAVQFLFTFKSTNTQLNRVLQNDPVSLKVLGEIQLPNVLYSALGATVQLGIH